MGKAGGANRGELIEDKFGTEGRVDRKVVRLGNELRAQGDVNDGGRSVVAQGTRSGNDLAGGKVRRREGAVLVGTTSSGASRHFLFS